MRRLFITNLLLVVTGSLQPISLPLDVPGLRSLDLPSQPQTQRPITLARQFEKDREKLRTTFERDLALGRAQPDDWEDRIAPLQRRVADLISGLRISDWKGEELRSLAALYYFSEQYALALDAYRKLVTEPLVGEKGEQDQIQGRMMEARIRLVGSMIQLDQIDQAALALAELARVDTSVPELLAARVLLHRDLCIAYRERLQFDRAARQAIAGYEVGRRISPSPLLADPVRDARDIETARLAAIAVTLFERMGQQRNAEELQRRWRQTGRGRSAQSQATFENELVTQRLLGRPVPDLAVKAWIGSPPLTSTSLRGKVVLLHFWAMWNTASTNQFDRLNKWQASYRDRGFQIVSVTRLFGRSDRQDGLTAATEMATLESFRQQRGMTFAIAVAGQDDVTNDERFNITTLPMFVLIDREGVIRRIDRDAIDYRKLGNEIDKLTANRQTGWNN